MGLDDLGDKKQEEVKEEQAEEIADKLGIEDTEDLQALDQRISDMSSELVSFHKSIERLEEKMENNRLMIRSVLTILDEEGMLTSPSKVEDEEEDSDNPWLSSQ